MSTDELNEKTESHNSDLLKVAFKKALFVYLIYSFFLLCLGLIIGKVFFPENFVIISIISWSNCFVWGGISISLNYLIQRRYGTGNILGIVTGMFVRSGIPLITVLALIPLLDNNILIKVVGGTLFFYVLLLPCEVYLMIPRKTDNI